MTIIEEYREIKDNYNKIADNIELEVGIGIDGGNAFFTMQRGNDCYDYTCIGRNINISKKIEEYAGRNNTEKKYAFSLGYCSLLMTKEFCKIFANYQNFNMEEIGRFCLHLNYEDDVYTVTRMQEKDCHVTPKCIDCNGNRTICRNRIEGRYKMKVEE